MYKVMTEDLPATGESGNLELFVNSEAVPRFAGCEHLTLLLSRFIQQYSRVRRIDTGLKAKHAL